MIQGKVVAIDVSSVSNCLGTTEGTSTVKGMDTGIILLLVICAGDAKELGELSYAPLGMAQAACHSVMTCQHV